MALPFQASKPISYYSILFAFPSNLQLHFEQNEIINDFADKLKSNLWCCVCTTNDKSRLILQYCTGKYLFLNSTTNSMIVSIANGFSFELT